MYARTHARTAACTHNNKHKHALVYRSRSQLCKSIILIKMTVFFIHAYNLFELSQIQLVKFFLAQVHIIVCFCCCRAGSCRWSSALWVLWIDLSATSQHRKPFETLGMHVRCVVVWIYVCVCVCLRVCVLYSGMHLCVVLWYASASVGVCLWIWVSFCVYCMYIWLSIIWFLYRLNIFYF